MRVTLQRLTGDQIETVTSITLNSDGRNDDGALLQGQDFLAGRYRLLFEAGEYFRLHQTGLPSPAFLETVPIEFGVADPSAHYHVPLLVSPWAYSTYRGS